MEIALIRPVAPFNRYIQNVPLNYIHLAAYLAVNALLVGVNKYKLTPFRANSVVPETIGFIDPVG